MKFFRNWKQICKIADLNLRLALALIDDEVLLAGLKRGFPKCFSAKRTKSPLIPASVLRQLAYEKSVEEDSSYVEYHGYDRELDWYGIAKRQFDIPAGPFWQYEKNPVPPEVRKQLIGQPIGFGMKVSWQGEEYLVANFCWDNGTGSNSDLGRILTVEDSQNDTMVMGLIPAKFVDLNS